jgi:flagellar biosynthesis protein FlhG
MEGQTGQRRSKRIVTLQSPRVIAVTSGKGGVGKTSIVANLALALTGYGVRVVVLDADVGLANLDIVLGLTPKYTLQHVFQEQVPIGKVLVDGPGGMKIIPSSSGVQELAELSPSQRLHLLAALETLYGQVDVLLIDTGAGISSNVMYFNMAAQEILVVVTSEPTSFTDAYALIKVLSLKYGKNRFKILVNAVKSPREAMEVFRNLSSVAQEFLSVSTDYWGYILFDEVVARAVKRRKAVLELFPQSEASRCFCSLAEKTMETPPDHLSRDTVRLFWQTLLADPGGADSSLSNGLSHTKA